jgi:hypothetical protein
MIIFLSAFWQGLSPAGSEKLGNTETLARGTGKTSCPGQWSISLSLNFFYTGNNHQFENPAGTKWLDEQELRGAFPKFQMSNWE